jgi:Cu(I)/Ag(I) efflux system periplasmic protein CusF
MSSLRPSALRRPLSLVAICLGVTLISCLAGGRQAGATEVVPTGGAERYTTRGVVRSFGPDKKYVNVAHEDIEGYMKAMTMSFEPRSASQLAGLAAGDRVRLTFTSTDDGRRLIDAIAKE